LVAAEGEEQARVPGVAVGAEWAGVRVSGAQEPGQEELVEGAVKNLENG